MSDAMHLSPRLLDYLAALSAGESVDETAARIVVSPEAVKTGRRTLYGRLGARNAAHAVALGYEGGLLPARTGFGLDGRVHHGTCHFPRQGDDAEALAARLGTS